MAAFSKNSLPTVAAFSKNSLPEVAASSSSSEAPSTHSPANVLIQRIRDRLDSNPSDIDALIEHLNTALDTYIEGPETFESDPERVAAAERIRNDLEQLVAIIGLDPVKRMFLKSLPESTLRAYQNREIVGLGYPDLAVEVLKFEFQRGRYEAALENMNAMLMWPRLDHLRPQQPVQYRRAA